MKCIKKIFDFYLKTSIHIGFSVLCLTKISIINFDINQKTDFYLFIFLGTILAYNCLKYVSFFYKKPNQIKQNLEIVLVSFVSFIGAFWCFFQLQSSVQIAFLQIGFVILLYPLLRNFGLIKMLLVSFCVTYITVYIPCLGLKFMPINLYIILIQRFLIIVCLLIPFEILDSKADEKYLKTIPVSFGIKATKLFGIVLISLFLALTFIDFKPQKIIIDTIITIITALFIAFSNTNRNKYYTSFWVESVPIVWLLVLIIQ